MILSIPGRFWTTVPEGTLMLIWICIAVAGVNAGCWLFDRLLGKRIRALDNTVAGVFFGAISVLYALIIAFVMMAEWDDYNDLTKTITDETDKLNNILSHSSSLPADMQQIINREIGAYCKKVIENEWQMQGKNAILHPSAIPALRHFLLTTNSSNAMQEKILNVLDQDLSAISDLRRQRLSHTHSQLPEQVWTIMYTGTILLIVFSFSFTTASVRLRRIYLSLLTCLVAMCFSIIYSLDHPFNPGAGLDSSPYQNVVNELALYHQPGQQ